MTKYGYRMAAIILLIVAIVATALYKMGVDNGAFDSRAIIDVTAGLLALWAITLVTNLIALAERVQNE